MVLNVRCLLRGQICDVLVGGVGFCSQVMTLVELGWRVDFGTSPSSLLDENINQLILYQLGSFEELGK
jgi:hypothetical protein